MTQVCQGESIELRLLQQVIFKLGAIGLLIEQRSFLGGNKKRQEKAPRKRNGKRDADYAASTLRCRQLYRHDAPALQVQNRNVDATAQAALFRFC